MAATSLKSQTWIVNFVLIFLFVSETLSSSSSQCTDGTYTHGNRTCCLCGAGQYLVDHCTMNLHYGKCNFCGSEMFTSQPNDQSSCNPCTSCSHPNENLEEEEACTPARDRKCRCKQDHYCVSDTETCRLCQPCLKCGAAGVKIPCTHNENTVCNEIEERYSVGLIVGIILTVLAVPIVVAVFIWKKTPYCKRQQERSYVVNDVEMQLLNDVDIQRHLPDIADVLGWKDMQDIARRNGMPNTVIETIQLDHPHDCQEQTIQLLGKWVESKGKKAPQDLIQVLKKMDKTAKIEKITSILSSAT